jgi:hypothetical protein
MKKEYIAPQADCFKVELSSMIAGTTLDPNAEGSQTITPSGGEENEFPSRRGGVWDDEY